MPDDRQRYEEILIRAMRYAERVVDRETAFEIAHEVAVEMLEEPSRPVTGTLLYLRVTSRLRNQWRAGSRRAVVEGAYLQARAGASPSWSQPGSALEVRELHDRIRRTLMRMPSGMREAFLLVREEELSYKEAAARLGVSVGTVHTQLSRANALLRDCVQQYQSGGASAVGPKGQQP
jgi:RNA polymerase sigma-70 factor (ECF subfamily)